MSTDSTEIAQTVQCFSKKINVHMRSNSSSGDQSSSIESIKEFLLDHEGKGVTCSANSTSNLTIRKLFADVKAVALIQCTSPFLRAGDLCLAHEKMLAGFSSVFSAFKDTHLSWSQDRISGNLMPVNFDPKERPRRQDITGKMLCCDMGKESLNFLLFKFPRKVLRIWSLLLRNTAAYHRRWSSSKP